MRQIEEVKKREKLLAMIIRSNYTYEGVDFITPNQYSQQVAYMHHPAGKVIDAHIHNLVHRNVVLTQEVLFIKKGKMRIDFYDEYEDYLESRNLYAGDTILLVSGGHGFKVLEEVEMIEVKQGPYAGESDKKKFVGVAEDAIKYIQG
ncbi:MAG: hypothetical protein K1W27_04550 [Lachnospiraceae bacterium]|jgi:mannose-6-phosphate isomerase-like protein (cupin superfamily)|nr:hypothetical protein C804_01645 [Lachnospiraceae bacterium A4]MCI8265555.1 hypothetical protein [Lachnospiraceae bacterium]